MRRLLRLASAFASQSCGHLPRHRMVWKAVWLICSLNVSMVQKRLGQAAQMVRRYRCQLGMSMQFCLTCPNISSTFRLKVQFRPARRGFSSKHSFLDALLLRRFTLV